MATYWVSNTGNDQNQGTNRTFPLKTIAKATSNAKAGDTVYFEPGIWNEQLIVKNSGTSTGWIKFSPIPGAPKDSVIIDGTNLLLQPDTELSGLIYIDGKSFIIIEGFFVKHAHSHRDSGGAGIMVRGFSSPFSNIIIKNNHIYDTTSSGIDCVGSGNVLSVIGNELEYGQNTLPKSIAGGMYGQWAQEGLSIGSETGGITGVIVSHNHVHHDALWVNGSTDTNNKTGCAGGAGICIKNYTKDCEVSYNEVDHMGDCFGWGFGMYVANTALTNTVENIRIFNNIIHDVQGVCLSIGSEGGVSKNIIVYNNIIYQGHDVDPAVAQMGIRLPSIHPDAKTGMPTEKMVSGLKVFNNTVFGFRIAGIGGGDGLMENVFIQNNISTGAGFKGMYIDGRYNPTIDHNLEIDPGFRNLSQDDFHISATSPAVGVGIDTGLAVDFDGKARPIPPSVGAYEPASVDPCPQPGCGVGITMV